jgi:hypothetical protein
MQKSGSEKRGEESGWGGGEIPYEEGDLETFLEEGELIWVSSRLVQPEQRLGDKRKSSFCRAGGREVGTESAGCRKGWGRRA